MERFAAIFKTLSDPTRLRILRLLLAADTELCVCELVDSLEEPQYNISKHVNALKVAGLLESRKEGRWVYYSPALGQDGFLGLLGKAISSISADRLKRDQAELKRRLRLREGGRCLKGVQKQNLVAKVPG